MARNPDSHNGQTHAKDNTINSSVILEREVKGFFNTFLERPMYLKMLSGPDYAIALENLTIGTAGCFRRQIKAPAGIGKTTRVIEHLARCKGKNIWFTVPNHKLAEQVAHDIAASQDAANIGVVLIRGRSEGNCQRFSLAENMGRKGIPIESSLCKSEEATCPFFKGCGYQQQRRDIEDLPALTDESNPRVFVMAHNYLINPSMAPKPDLVIIDESHWRVFCHDSEVSISDIKNIADAEEYGYEGYLKAIESLEKAIRQNGPSFTKALRNEGWGLIDVSLKHIERIAKKNAKIPIKPSSTDNSIKKFLRDWNGTKLKHVQIMLESLKHELTLGHERPLSLVLTEQNSIQVFMRKQPFIDRGVPVLIIDASADLKINRCIWGKGLQERIIHAERKAYVVQVRKSFSKYSMGVFSGIPDDEQLYFRKIVIEVINAIAEYHGSQVFLATPKSVLVVIQGDLSENILTANYSNLRGQNGFKDCEVGILLGRELPNCSDVEKLARCLYSNSKKTILHVDEYSKFSGEYRMQDGSLLDSPKIWSHPDSFCQRILQQIREEELGQALDRLRLIYTDKEKIIYIFCNIPLDITVNRLWTWKEFLSGGSRLERAMNQAFETSKTFPLSYREWSRLFPDFWSTPDKAKGDQRRCGGIKGVEKQLIYILENAPFNKVLYRRNMGHRRWSCAIVSAHEENPRTALEKIVGPIMAFKMCDPFNYGDPNTINHLTIPKNKP